MKTKGNGNGRKPHYSDMPYGNGCRLFKDCLNCPLPDCVWEKGLNIKRQNVVIKLWEPYLTQLERVP